LSQRYRLIVNADLCTGCKACVESCTLRNDGEIRPNLARLWVYRREDRDIYIPFICEQCESAPCAQVCPVDCITLDPVTQAYVIDRERCIGCKMCMWACPFGVIRLDDEGIAIKCEYCGGDPACAKACLPGALKWADINDPQNLVKWEVVNKAIVAKGVSKAIVEEV
jgi:Fe-S-cluster-containing dehydrogenase component